MLVRCIRSWCASILLAARARETPLAQTWRADHLIFRVTSRHGRLPRSAGKRQAGCLRSQPVVAVIKQPQRATIPAPFIATIRPKPDVEFLQSFIEEKSSRICTQRIHAKLFLCPQALYVVSNMNNLIL